MAEKLSGEEYDPNLAMLSELYENISVLAECDGMPSFDTILDPSAYFLHQSEGSLVYVADGKVERSWPGLYAPETTMGERLSPAVVLIAPGRIHTEDDALPIDARIIAAAELYAHGDDSGKDLALQELEQIIESVDPQS